PVVQDEDRNRRALFKPFACGVTIAIYDHASARAGLRKQKRLIARLIRPAQNLPSVRDLDAAPALAPIAATQDGDLVPFVAQEAGEEGHAWRLARAADGQIADADHGRFQSPRLEKAIFV